MQVRTAQAPILSRMALVISVASAALALPFAATATATGRFGPGGPTQAPPQGAPVVTATGQVAHQLAELGRGAYADVFAGITVDERNGRVILRVTDARRGRDLAAAAADRLGADAWEGTTVSLHRARYTREQLVAAATRMKRKAKDLARSGVEIDSIAVRDDGGGLVATTDSPERAKARTRTAGAAARQPPVTFKSAPRVSDLSRYQDVPPYAGGIHVGAGGPSLCSSAFAIRRGSGTLLVSAEHCFLWNYLDVYTGMGARYIGRVSLMNDRNDAAGIPTNALSGVWTSNDHWTHYGSVAWSFKGQEVCQSGVTSNRNCQIRLRTSYLEWRGSNGVWHAGVEGCSPSGAAAVRPGDSGGPVYVWMSDGRLQSRGIVSGGRSTDGDPDLECLLFTETISLLNAWGATLLIS